MAAVADTRTLRLTRIFDATPERVFDAWIVQDRFVQWMCPPGVTVQECVIDVRPGGGWRIKGLNRSGKVFASSGIYVVVERPVRLEFTWAHHSDGDYALPRGHETTVRIEFRAVGAKTELTLLHGPFADDPSTEGHREGWGGSFDKLEAFLRRTA
ncbi:Uncharacterized conserved protein YndB, AHSA1/START domain [Enhydrobacter aerosaccus]|uniref:Uncharacterized conserved protein YndB, AHSA1/START domain n=1 Tax=Enhydrobacter aerosaccus TaxID=225324 RepID=A0A1T4JVS9_9HYPH|nr:SRPBCC domain-containing protein [Enhydrobacter aerosaccus]SJZ34244.1 Uncharacterized conserved protein YndB, AHSA1/START domain [Enhydrobacter aerosaccus]